jgi:hypothetical protein
MAIVSESFEEDALDPDGLAPHATAVSTTSSELDRSRANRVWHQRSNRMFPIHGRLPSRWDWLENLPEPMMP